LGGTTRRECKNLPENERKRIASPQEENHPPRTSLSKGMLASSEKRRPGGKKSGQNWRKRANSLERKKKTHPGTILLRESCREEFQRTARKKKLTDSQGKP